MLVLKRKSGESLLIGDNIEVRIIEVEEGKVKIGVEAPKNVTILRSEVLEAAKEENKAALSSRIVSKEALKKVMKK
ncbi:MAG: carbon storage regulator CsrA [Peptostreptococcaceae bacterium]|nr:carbon storage regulator CsrA [Peptostreptococcaceae bacterium]